MTVFHTTDGALAKVSFPAHSPMTICMHVRGVARLDARVMRSATALDEAGFVVHIVDIESERMRPLEEDIYGIHVRHILRPDWLIPTRLPWRLLKSVQKLIASTILLIQIPADIYHAHNVNALLPCYIAAQLRGKCLIFDAHEMPLYELENTRHHWSRAMITQLFVVMIRRCAGVITVSPPIIKEMYDRYHNSEVSLIRNIPSYRVVPKSNRLRGYLGLSPNTRIVLYQGNLQPDRNLDKLVHVAAFLERDAVIVLMGKGVGSIPTELEALAVSKGVTDRLKIIPPVSHEELLDWTASADVGIIVSSPTYSLNTRMFLPNKFFEYLMVGLPVLSSPLQAVTEIIKTYGVGRVLTSLEPVDIAAEINAMLADHAEIQRMRRNALEAAKREFCWEKERQELIRLYHSIL